MIKKLTKRFLRAVVPLLSAVFLIGTTAVILIIVSGYSIDINKKQLIKTGVLNIETNPSDAAISINNQYSGNSNKAIPNLTIGSYSVQISKPGFYDYKKNVEISHGLATLISVPLIKETGADPIITTAKTDMFYQSDIGLFILSIPTQTPSITPSITTSSTPTPSPTDTKKKTVTITRIDAQKNFFDSAKPSLVEKLNFDLPTGLTVADFSISSLGKNILLKLKDSKDKQFLYIIPFTSSTLDSIQTFFIDSLTSYTEDKDSIVEWSKNPDYILVTTKNEIVSYNIKTKARIILTDKIAQSTDFIYTSTQFGIITVKKSTDTATTPIPLTKQYSIEQISFNGNSLETQIPKITLDSKPTDIWSSVTDTQLLLVISTDKGSYLIGNMFSTRGSEYEINQTTKQIENKEITILSTTISFIKFSDTSVNDVTFNNQRFAIAYTSLSNSKLVVFTYNKRTAEHYIALGEKVLIEKNNTEIIPIKWILSGNYLSFLSNNNLWAIDASGTNLYQLQNGVSYPTYYLDDSVNIYKGNDSKLYFKNIQ